ncbi:hypothetical protein E4U21_006807 [Claviceps maximensis]|nr:hypothetical protein E4U21_006807 [Claviceps maximensis]
MPANASPTKSRVALAPRDVNANPSLPLPKMLKDVKVPVPPSPAGTSPLRKRVVPATVSGAKRPAEDTCSPGNKKKCVEENTRLHRSRTSSPSTSSIFDTSAAEGDASWATTTTEPEINDAGAGATGAPALVAPRPRGSMTREQAREKAEILRLRLGLASYKLRTGQTGVPLADLQQKPLPPRTSIRVQSPTQGALDASGENRDFKPQESKASSTSSSTSSSTNTPDTRPETWIRPAQGDVADERQAQSKATCSD